MQADEKEKIIKSLGDRLAKFPCPRCGNQQFSLVDGYFNQVLQENLSGGIILGGPAIPSVVVVCGRCGFMSQHALGVLGLLPQQKSDDNK